ESLIFLIGGQVAPTLLLPDLLQGAARLLPFRYMVAFPVEILAGQLTPAEIGTGFALQVAWLGVALLLFVALWRAGLRRYSAVGG
ncbi:MAG: ABC-2 family transporter protein, partial [Anaerolineae bacterium]